MSVALAQRLSHEPKQDLINKVVRFKQSVLRQKEAAKHAGNMVISGVLASAGGATAGVLAVKMPVIPKTNAPTDLVLGGALGVAAALGIFDDLDPHINSYANGLIGAGMARLTAQALSK